MLPFTLSTVPMSLRHLILCALQRLGSRLSSQGFEPADASPAQAAAAPASSAPSSSAAVAGSAVASRFQLLEVLLNVHRVMLLN